jgi:hypothetical protein
MAESHDMPAGNLLVMGFDSRMFRQAQLCLATVRRHCRHAIDIGVVAIDLAETEIDWLKGQGIKISQDCRSLPFYAEAPPYAYAMTCRPYLPQIFPGYEYYVWIDADVRICGPEAFEFYIGAGRQFPKTIVVVHEVDPCYTFCRNPVQANGYHIRKHERIAGAFGEADADSVRYFNSYNAGIFGMHRDAAVWEPYRRRLETAMRGPFHHMLEQDAMLLAIMDSGMQVTAGASIMNWLCSIHPPWFDPTQGRWVRPIFPHLPIACLHLTQSMEKLRSGDITWYEWYERMRMTEP